MDKYLERIVNRAIKNRNYYQTLLDLYGGDGFVVHIASNLFESEYIKKMSPYRLGQIVKKFQEMQDSQKFIIDSDDGLNMLRKLACFCLARAIRDKLVTPPKINMALTLYSRSCSIVEMPVTGSLIRVRG